ncbi:MAG: polysaccharide biosynthesis/export family protein [Terracidiphilus sp.]
MAKNRFSFSHVLLVLLGVALPAAMIAVPATAQSGSAPLSSMTATSNKASASASQSPGIMIVPRDISELRIEPGDLLNVNVYDAPELSGQFRVDNTGNLTLPLCGKVNLLGVTAAEAAKRLEAALKDGQIMVQPQVNLDVAQYAGEYVTVMGEVANPGRVVLIAPTMLGDVLAQAGGLTALAGAHIKIRHGANETAPEEDIPYSRTQNSRESASVLVRPGDSIIVPRAGIVYVMGAVYHPGGYVMQEDGKLNVAQALALAGGTSLQAKTGGLRVIRRNPDGTVLDFPLSYDRITKGTETPLVLQAQDIVYVPMSKIKSSITSAVGVITSISSDIIIYH